MARPRQMSDEDILRHAREVFLEHGPHVSTQVVADRCELSQAALFKRFGTKKELLIRALLPRTKPAVFARIEDGPSEGPIGPQLESLALEIALFFREHIPCIATLQASGIDKFSLLRSFDVPPPVQLQRLMTGWLEACGDRIHPNVDRLAIATALLGTLHVRSFLHYIGGSKTPDNPAPYIKTVVHAFLHGIGGSE